MQFLFYKILFIFLLVACQQEASISLSDVELNNYNQSNNSNQNNSNPTIVSLIAPSDGSYKENDELIFTIDISEAVTITGTSSYVSFNLGGNARQAICSAGTVTSATCSYTIQAGENDSDGIEFSSPLVLSGSTIVDADGNNLDLTFTATSAANVLVDTSAPTIISVTPPSNGSYIIGSSIDYLVEYSEPVNVASEIARLIIDVGGVTRYADLRDGNRTKYLTFSYLIAEGDLDLNGITNNINIDPNGATLRDVAGNTAAILIGAQSTSGVIIDAIAPTIAISSPLNNSYINAAAYSTTFAISGTCSENGRTVTIKINRSDADDPSGFICNGTNFSGTVNVTGLVDGSHKITASISDSAGNSVETGFISVSIDTSAPTTSSFVINDNDASTNSTSVNLKLSATGASQMYITNTAGCSSGGAWESYATTKTWTLGQTNGVATVYVKYRDEAGNESGCNDDTITHGSSAPTSTSIAINSSEYTTSTSVSLTLSATEATQMYITNTAGCSSGGTWESYATSKAWTLGQTNGEATVYVKYRNSSLTESSCISDTITHDNTAPSISSVSAPAGATYKASTNLDFTVTFSEAVSKSGTPRIALSIGAATVYANYFSGVGTGTWVFRYTVQAGDTDTDGIASASPIDLNGATIQDSAGNNSSLTFTAPNTTSVLVDTQVPIITSVTVPANGSYKANNQLSFTVNFSESVTISGTTSYITLNIGGTNRQAICQAGSGTSTTCSYTIQAGENDSNGIAYTSPVILSTSSMRDIAGNDLDLTFSDTTSTTGVLVDSIAPTIVSVTPPSNGSYILGESIDYVVEYSEPVSVTNVPRLIIDVGGVERYAVLTSGSGSKYLSFSYTVAAGDLDLDGITNNIDINLNGATIRDVAGNDAVTLIGAQSTSGVLIDTVPPASTTIAINASELTSSTSVTLNLSATGATQMYVTNTATCSAGGNWESYSTSRAWTLGQTNAIATVYVKFRDAVGNESTCISDTITHDDLAPSSTSISIAAGATYSTDPSASVTLTLAATGASEMYITNTATCSAGGNWESYSTSKAWTLGQTNATATVYVKYRDEAGNESSCINDTIIHDSTAPTVTTIAINSSEVTSSTSVTLNLAATGATQMYVTNTAGCGSGGALESYATTRAWTLGQTNGLATVYVKYIDAAGNESSCINDTITHEDSAPTSTSISIAAGATHINTNPVTLTLAATGATQMYITNTAGCGSGGTWESYATSKAWTLGQTNATATVYVKYRNASLTESSCINDTIIHDNTAPTISSIVMPVNKNYTTGQTLDFTVNFSESVTITNTPRIAITLTSGTVYANYFTGSNSANIVFRYTVESSHADANGINLVSPLDLNGGTIRDLASNNATLTFSPPTNTILINYNLARLVWLDESSNIILAYDFGQPGVVTTKQFYLKNNKTSSTSALTTSFTLPSTFFSYVTNNCNTVSLAAGATCSIQIRFDPTVAGEDGTKLAVANATGNIFDPTQIAPLALTGTK